MHTTALLSCVLFITQLCLGQTTQSNEDRNRAMPAADAVASQQLTFTPMTKEERLHHYLRTTFNLESVLRSGFGAGISQWQNTPSEWGQGTEGYATRVANSYGQHVIRQTMMFGASSLLHEDNRYILSPHPGFGPRVKDAVESSFLARRDDGTRRLSYSLLGSYIATAFISREWQPRSTNGAQNAINSFGTVMGTTVAFNVAREFLPTVFHRHSD
jgi:hypothetical protein